MDIHTMAAIILLVGTIILAIVGNRAHKNHSFSAASICITLGGLMLMVAGLMLAVSFHNDNVLIAGGSVLIAMGFFFAIVAIDKYQKKFTREKNA